MRLRKYPYGAISRALVLVLTARPSSADADEITTACHAVYGIDHDTTWRNLRSMCSRGLITNVGTRQKALYVLKEGKA